MKKNKKGIDIVYGKIITIIVLITGFILIGALTSEIYASVFSNPDEKACKTKLALTWALKQKFLEQYSPTIWPANCITQY